MNSDYLSLIFGKTDLILASVADCRQLRLYIAQRTIWLDCLARFHAADASDECHQRERGNDWGLSIDLYNSSLYINLEYFRNGARY